ncbi:MAG: hypothetical protein LBS62_11870 [Clostridiales bacterium]|jgi:hypothetical protein|nr:hypothetical protein [Clostridiales bacterium]
MKSRKQVIIKISIVFICVIFVIVFFSSTIYNMNLPSVTVAYAGNGAITRRVSGSGVVELVKTETRFAEWDGKVEYFGKPGDIIAEGEPLYAVVWEEESGEHEFDLEAARIKLETVKLRLKDLGNAMAAAESALTEVRAALAGEDTSYDTGLESQLDTLNLQMEIAEGEKERLLAQQKNNDLKQAEDFEKDRLEKLSAKDSEIDKVLFDIAQAEQARQTALSTFEKDASEQLKREKEETQAEIDALKAKITQRGLDKAALENDLKMLKDRQKKELDRGTSVDYTEEMHNEAKKQLSYEIDQKNLEILSVQTEIDDAEKDVSELEEKARLLRRPDFDSAAHDALLAALNYSLERLMLERSEIENAAGPKTAGSDAIMAKDDEIRGLELSIAQTTEKRGKALAAAEKERGLEIEALRSQREAAELELLSAENELARLESRGGGQPDSQVITADKDYVIISQEAVTGEFLRKNARIMTIGEANGLYSVKMTLPAEAEEVIYDSAEPPDEIRNTQAEPTIKLSINIPSKKKYNIAAAVSSIVIADEEMLLTAQFKESGLTGGEQAQLRLVNVLSLQQYVLPNTAIFDDNGAQCIYIVELRDSSIGSEYVLRKMTISVIAADDMNSSINAWGLENTPIVINCDDEIYEGARVRLLDGEEYVQTR